MNFEAVGLVLGGLGLKEVLMKALWDLLYVFMLGRTQPESGEAGLGHARRRG